MAPTDRRRRAPTRRRRRTPARPVATDDPGREGDAPAATAADEHRPGRARLSVLIGTIIALLVCANLGNAFFPTLSTEYPLMLIALSSANRNLILASGQLPFVAYFVVATIRLILPDIAFFYLGYDYGDRALGWMERRTPRVGAMLRELESLFGRYGYFIVPLAPLLIPSNPICLVAGAVAHAPPGVLDAQPHRHRRSRPDHVVDRRRRSRAPSPGCSTSSAEYRLPLTVVTVGLVGFTFWRETKQGTSGIQQLRELEDEIERRPRARQRVRARVVGPVLIDAHRR